MTLVLKDRSPLAQTKKSWPNPQHFDALEAVFEVAMQIHPLPKPGCLSTARTAENGLGTTRHSQ